MKIDDVKQNLFVSDSKYVFAHCISQDCAMGAGIAKTFSQKFRKLKSNSLNNYRVVGIAQRIDLFENRIIYNLITKKNYFDKPTYQDLELSLTDLRDKMISHNEKFLAIPKIGCGLDCLEWERVRVMIEDIFLETDIEILVCYL